MNTNSENYVIVRADKAGVFFGQLVKKEGNEVTLNNCRKLYYWRNACAVEQLALDGVLESTKDECKFTVAVSNATINNYIQIIPCSEKAILSIQSVPEWKK
jgi:hypothetical protein